ncbi:hypothetical protein [Helicobacter sp. UBA3407]|uniref:hypothetical protein n=1 Tax=Helicobacter sp. UBA3407 TaxID=1946588 RepID=UPI002608569B|nr:hypothetical protein [Helicobacter sp. UBA3407]
MCFRNLYSDFVFKGNRQYVHGTSIYDFLLENVVGGGGGGHFAGLFSVLQQISPRI